MKKSILLLITIFGFIVTAKGMSYQQARIQALFLTDKMAYELNLTDDQYEAAYEINLDYLMSIVTIDDLYDIYWRRRNMDLSYILFSWQYDAYCAASYFYRPLYWDRGYWHFAIYARYPRRDYYYYGHPHFYSYYRGEHSWRSNGNRSWYHGRQFGNGNRYGLRDRFERGHYGRGTIGIPSRSNNDIGREYGGYRGQMGNRSTYTNDNYRYRSNTRSFGNRRGQSDDVYMTDRSRIESISSNRFGSGSTRNSGSFMGNRNYQTDISSSHANMQGLRSSINSSSTRSFGNRR